MLRKYIQFLYFNKLSSYYFTNILYYNTNLLKTYMHILFKIVILINLLYFIQLFKKIQQSNFDLSRCLFIRHLLSVHFEKL